MKQLLNIPIGSLLTCINCSSDVEVDQNYVFVGYDDSLVPKNNYNATMTWYPDKPIWSLEEYDNIRIKFMRIKLDGIENPQWLKDFVQLEFTS